MATVQRQDDGWQTLTPREREICELLTKCGTNREIAKQLGISVKTVANHVHRILRKLEVPSRRHVIAHYGPSPFDLG